LSFRTKWGIPI